MPFDVMGISSAMDDSLAIQETTSSGLKTLDHLISLLTHHGQNQQLHRQQRQVGVDCSELTVLKCNQVINSLNRTGHARFRRASINSPSIPSQPEPKKNTDLFLELNFNFEGNRVRQPVEACSLDLGKSSATVKSDKKPCFDLEQTRLSNRSKDSSFNISPPVSSSTTSSFMSTITGDGSVSNGKLGLTLFAPKATAAGKPPLSSSHRKKCSNIALTAGKLGKISQSGRCHCSKRRRSRVKHAVRVPAVSSKVADIPPDEYSWRKYGQKPIKGSQFPRGYYKCSTMKGCPARKRVERAMDDPKMLVVTYEGEHRHQHDIVPGTVNSGNAMVL